MNDIQTLQNFFPSDITASFTSTLVQNVQVSDLSCAAHLYNPVVSFEPEEKPLILQPLIVYKNEKHLYTIIDGFKRFNLITTSCKQTCDCMIIPYNLTKLQITLLRILLNINRPWDLREQERLVVWCSTGLDIKTQMELLNRAGIDSKRMKAISQFVSQNDFVKSAVYSHNVHIENIHSFLLLTEPDQQAYLDFFANLPLSLQYEREFLEWLPEIAYSQQKQVSDIFSSQDLLKIKTDTLLNSPQKIQKIRSILFALRFPHYDELLEEWKNLAHKNFSDTSKIAISPNPFFEKNKLELRLTFTHTEEAMAITQRLSQIPKETWKRLIHPVKSKK